MKYKLAEDIIIQKFEDERYVIDLKNEKTYSVNEDAFRILESINDVFLDVSEICDMLGESTSSVDKKYIQEFIESVNKIDLLVCQ